jgi:hypothetical protein
MEVTSVIRSATQTEGGPNKFSANTCHTVKYFTKYLGLQFKKIKYLDTA